MSSRRITRLRILSLYRYSSTISVQLLCAEYYIVPLYGTVILLRESKFRKKRILFIFYRNAPEFSSNFSLRAVKLIVYERTNFMIHSASAEEGGMHITMQPTHWPAAMHAPIAQQESSRSHQQSCWDLYRQLRARSHQSCTFRRVLTINVHWNAQLSRDTWTPVSYTHLTLPTNREV